MGSQTQTPKRSKVLISGVSFRQRSLSQSQESDVLSYSERKITKNFQGFAPGPHWGGLTAPSQNPQLHNGFSPCYARRKTGTPKKLLATALTSYSNLKFHNNPLEMNNILGEFNLDGLDSDVFEQITSTLTSFYFVPFNCTHLNGSLIDQVFVRKTFFNKKKMASPDINVCFSDHDAVDMRVEFKPN